MENRVLIYAPTGKDAKLIAQVLVRAHIEAHVCIGPAEVIVEMNKGVGALLLVDEALSTSLLKPLTHILGLQPTWSDLPVFVMSNRSLASPEIRGAYHHLGNVTLLERPVQGITLVSAATAALRARKRQYAMREVDRRKDEFLAMLAHELRNPLAPVSAASDLLKLPNLSQSRIKQTSEIISRQVQHMTGLIDDLLDMSRVSRGLVTLERNVLDARQIVTNAVEQVRPLIDGRGHRLTLHTSPELVYIDGDQKRLIQIVSNVLNNAAKYTPEGGEIVLSMEADNSSVTLTITDNGIGMEPDVIEHIFDMFSQAERTSDRTQGGLGIGLALVKNLVQLHDGTVTAASDGPGNGSQFKLTFPRSFHVEETASVSGSSEERVTPLNLLLVDDNVDAATMLGLFLELAGHRVTVVHSGTAALDAIAGMDHVDACLLDIGLPDMDGKDLAKRLRSMPVTAKAMLVAITGYGQAIDRSNTQEAGFNHHYVKPVNMAELVNTLATLHS